MRIPYAARTLQSQVQERRNKAEIEPFGEEDGLGVVRTLRFDKATSKWLAPLLEAIAPDDPRVEWVEVTEAGYLHVTFVGTPDADQLDEFPLDDAAEVAES